MFSTNKWQSPQPSINKHLFDMPIDFKKKDAPQSQTKINKITEYKRSCEKLRENVNNLKNYLNKYGEEGDNQYAYKLTLQFLRSQAIAKNLEEETRTIKLNLHRAMRPLEEIKWKQIPDDHKENNNMEQQVNNNIITPAAALTRQQNSDQQQLDSITSEDILQNSKKIEQLLLQRKNKKKPNNKINTPKKTQKVSSTPRFYSFPTHDHDQEYSDNQVYFDSEQSDQSMISLEESSGEEEESQNSEEEDYEDSESDQNFREFYYDEDYEQGFMDEQDYQVNNLMKLFTSSRHKKQQSLNRTQYSQMSNQQKQKYFKKLNSDFNKRIRHDTRPPLSSLQTSQKKPKKVSFNNSVKVKVFNKHSKAAEVFLTNEKEQILVRQIWQYDEQ